MKAPPDLETILGIEARIAEIENRLTELAPLVTTDVPDLSQVADSNGTDATDADEWKQLTDEKEYLLGREDRLAKLLTGNR